MKNEERVGPPKEGGSGTLNHKDTNGSNVPRMEETLRRSVFKLLKTLELEVSSMYEGG
jgi:hypothetical protein